MSSGFINTTAKALLDELIGGGAGSTWPVTIFIALSTADPTADGSGAIEPIGNGYARVSSAVFGDWSAATDGATGEADKTHTTTIAFPQASGGSWGTVAHYLIYDALTVGNLLHWGQLDNPVTINNGDDQRFEPGALVIRLKNIA